MFGIFVFLEIEVEADGNGMLCSRYVQERESTPIYIYLMFFAKPSGNCLDFET